MQAGAAVSAGPFDANSQSTSLLSQLQTHRQSHRSTSLSSGSVVTVKRPGSLSRDDNEAAHIQRRLSRDPIPSHSPGHKRRKSVAIDPYEHPSLANDSTGLGSVNRWSHSTSSSLASLANANTRRNRSSSGAVLTSLTGPLYTSPRQKPLNALDASPSSSPRRHHVSSTYSPVSSPVRSRRQSRTENPAASLTALPPLHTTPALTNPNDNESPSTVQTLPTPQGSNYVHDDYFYDGYGMAKTKRVAMVRNPSAPVTVPQSSRLAQSEQLEQFSGASRIDMEQRQKTAVPDGSSGGSRRPRNREKMEKDKKTMLSKALQKANTAVLLDNAQNYDGALEAYGDACDLLTQVMDRTSGDDDKRKLDAIRVTYSNRMEELQMLVQERSPTSHEKHLPARPMSEESLSLRAGPVSPIEAATREQDESPFIATPREDGNAPQLPYSHNDRDSFFSRTMAAVENSASFSSAPEHVAEEPRPVHAGAQNDASEHLHRMTIPPPEHAQYVPRPLSPRRPSAQSPQLQPQAEQAWQYSPGRTQGEPTSSHSRDEASTSWLDPIDESGSSCSDSLHSRSSRQGTRRKHLRELSGETDPDFDAAFDAAVEAAYDEGFEPDLEARRKRETADRMRPDKESIRVPASEIEEIMPGIFQSTAITTDEDEEEEERILDDLAHDYGNAFNFDLKTTKSAIPRASDSSGYSRSTWQSSQMSDRATAATSLSTVAEDGLASRMSNSAPLRESTALPLSAPLRSSLPRPPSAGNNRTSNVRSRRLSGMNSKQLKIETVSQPEVRKRASTFHHASSPFLEDDEQTESESENKIGEALQRTLSEVQHEHILQSPPSLELHAALDEMSQSFDVSTTIDHRPSYEGTPGDRPGTRPTLFRKNKSSISLRDHSEHQVLLASPDLDSSGMSNAITPMSSTFMSFAASKRNQNPLASQRAQLPSLGHVSLDSQQLGGGIHLFDTSLSTMQSPMSPRSPSSPLPAGLEPCPEPFLLRPFWFMRALSATIGHPRGGFLTTKLFIPRQVWETKGVKLKFVEDKIASCDLLTAALGRLAGVDTYDADAVAEELQSFEEVMDRVQGALAKRLGSDVGVHGATGMFKDATSAAAASGTGIASDSTAGADKAAKSNSGRSYLSSWRKLRNKSSGTPLSAGVPPAQAKSQAEKEQLTMQSVPMTSFVPVERRGNKKEARNLVFEGVNREYMGSLARLFDGIQILDQIARQVEDPGLKHSSPTHVDLELSIRHAAEFFGFYVCRFVLADLGLLMDKFLKRGTEWVLA